MPRTEAITLKSEVEVHQEEVRAYQTEVTALLSEVEAHQDEVQHDRLISLQIWKFKRLACRLRLL